MLATLLWTLSTNMIRELVPANHPALNFPVETFDFNNPSVVPIDLATDLAETMFEYKGIGLAATQVGLLFRAFIMLADELIPVFNPRIVDSSTETIYLEEGCLTHPGLFVKIKRPRRIKVRYAEPNGNIVTRVFDGMTARIFQHELDHLDGIDYLQRASRIHIEQARSKHKKWQRANKKESK